MTGANEKTTTGESQESGAPASTDSGTTDTTDSANAEGGTGTAPTTPSSPPPTPSPAPTPPPSPTPPAAQEDLVAAHQRQVAGVQAFRVNGAEISNFSAVQAHIDALETFRQNTVAAQRNAFVDELATKRVILPPQVESFRQLVSAMDQTQFDLFQTTYKDAPANNIFGRHDLDQDSKGGPDPTAERVQILEESVANFRRARMTEDEIHKTPVWAELQQLKGA